jgi:hypothetical protein
VAAIFHIASGLSPFTTDVHPRGGDGSATYECMNTRAYAGVDEICTFENTIVSSSMQWRLPTTWETSAGTVAIRSSPTLWLMRFV